MNTSSPQATTPQLLFTCPRCNRTGFYSRGLLAHVCRGNQINDRRRRLTIQELADTGVHPTTIAHFDPAKQGGAS